jgi:hypothetical protein
MHLASQFAIVLAAVFLLRCVHAAPEQAGQREYYFFNEVTGEVQAEDPGGTLQAVKTVFGQVPTVNIVDCNFDGSRCAL